MIELELTEPFHVTVGTTGQPGERTFYLQAQDEEEAVTFKLEKAQVEGMCELLGELLARLEDAPATDWDRAAMELRGPIEPRWNVGMISLGLDEDAERFAIEVAELQVGAMTEPREARIWCTVDQVRRLTAHGQEVLGRGRPRCELCGRPMAVDGAHVCPATNGHGRLTR